MTITVCGQDISNSDLIKKWKVSEGWFPEDSVVLTTTSSDSYFFTFSEDGAVHYSGDSRPSCAVGMTILSKGSWELENDILSLDLKGMVISVSEFWWVMKYKCSMDGGNLTLELMTLTNKSPSEE